MIPNPAKRCQFLITAAGQLPGVFKWPVQPLGYPGKYRALFSNGFIAQRYYIIIQFALFEKIKYAIWLLPLLCPQINKTFILAISVVPISVNSESR
jgi:hypothetical protein